MSLTCQQQVASVGFIEYGEGHRTDKRKALSPAANVLVTCHEDVTRNLLPWNIILHAVGLAGAGGLTRWLSHSFISSHLSCKRQINHQHTAPSAYMLENLNRVHIVSLPDELNWTLSGPCPPRFSSLQFHYGQFTPPDPTRRSNCVASMYGRCERPRIYCRVTRLPPGDSCFNCLTLIFGMKVDLDLDWPGF